MDLSKEFSTNEKAEIEGVWVDLGEESKLLIARAFNDNFVKAWRALPTGLRRRIDKGNVSRKEDLKLFSGLLSDSILLDWTGLSDEGKVIKYSKENATKMLAKYKEFRNFVWEMAGDIQLFRNEELEEDIKNSKGSSVGN